MNIKSKAAGLALLLVLGLTSAASAASGFVTGNVNLRAGPSTSYPVVVTLVVGEPVEVYGCLSGYSWCDVYWNGYRGWVSALYLDAYYESRVVDIVYVSPPIISFSFGSYWDDHYRGRSFYRYRDRYYRDYDRDRGKYRQDRKRRQDAGYERGERRQDVRQNRRERRQDARQERRQDRRVVRRERREEVRQDRRRGSRQEFRRERRQESRQNRGQNRRQDARQERRQERRGGGRRGCPPGQAC